MLDDDDVERAFGGTSVLGMFCNKQNEWAGCQQRTSDEAPVLVLPCRCMQTGSFPFRCVIHRGRAPPNRWKNQDCVDGWPASCMFVQFVRASGPDVNPEKFPWQASQLMLGLFKPSDLTCWGGAMV